MKTISFPFDEMLVRLQGVPGFDGFRQFVLNNHEHTLSWKAEVKSLYELYEAGHLTRICSHERSEPEGEFRVGGMGGIVEAAFVQYLFDGSDDARKALNKIQSELHRLPDGTTRFNSEHSLTATKKQAGTIATGPNVDIVAKVKRLFEVKRKQHTTNTAVLRAHYFYLDCPPPALWRAKDELQRRLQGMVKANEAIVIAAVGVARDVQREVKFEIYSPVTIFATKLNLTNPFYVKSSD
jgi:hypothetical protein